VWIYECCLTQDDFFFSYMDGENKLTANTIAWPTLRNWHWVSVKNESLRQKRWFQFSHCELSMAWLTVTGYLCHKWLRICSACRDNNPFFSSFMSYHLVCKKSNTTGTTNETAYPWFFVTLSLVFCVIFCKCKFSRLSVKN
jgi:hypothetical protein